MMRNLVAGFIGIGLVIAFLGIMIVWVPVVPLIVIVVFVMSLLIYDWIKTMRFGESGPGR